MRDIRAVRYSRRAFQYCGAFGPSAETNWCLVVVVDGRDMTEVRREDRCGPELRDCCGCVQAMFAQAPERSFIPKWQCRMY